MNEPKFFNWAVQSILEREMGVLPAAQFINGGKAWRADVLKAFQQEEASQRERAMKSINDAMANLEVAAGVVRSDRIHDAKWILDCARDSIGNAMCHANELMACQLTVNAIKKVLVELGEVDE